jgi:acyl dehydratase
MTLERFPVEATHILMFARSIGDPNPAFADPASAEAKALGGIVAPPTFAMAGFQFDEDHPLRPKPGEPWFGSGREPSGKVPEGNGSLHAEQTFEYHQPLRPGMVLTVEHREGERWEKQSKRGGSLAFEETITEYRDSDGELVVTARMVAVTPQKPPVEKEA